MMDETFYITIRKVANENYRIPALQGSSRWDPPFGRILWRRPRSLGKDIRLILLGKHKRRTNNHDSIAPDPRVDDRLEQL